MVGSAVGAWWWARQRSTSALADRQRLARAARDHGTVIFHNSPTTVEGDIL
jgi:hypothetical protein